MGQVYLVLTSLPQSAPSSRVHLDHRRRGEHLIQQVQAQTPLSQLQQEANQGSLPQADHWPLCVYNG